jgi:cytosine/adenosine deaminase-related metal-dependent hydrolase
VLSPLRYRIQARDSALVVHGGRVADPGAGVDLVLDVGDSDLRPGLINAHDHLHRNHYPRLGPAPGSRPYLDAYEWGRDIHAREADVIARARSVDRRDALLFGALKNIVAGVTTVVHHDPWEPAFDDEFPLHVARVRTVHSLGIEREQAALAAHDGDTPLCIHLAEGTTPAMADEVRDADRLGLLGPSLLAVHVVGVDADGIDRIVARGTTVVWCPTSNELLLGRTAPGELLARAAVLLGSDSLVSGAGTLLDELRRARAMSLVDDARLLAAVGTLAAERLALPLPALVPGAPADFVCFDAPVLDARAEDVALVVVAGVPRLAHPRFAPLFEHAGLDAERLRVGHGTKLVCAPLGAVADRILAAWPEASRIFA